VAALLGAVRGIYEGMGPSLRVAAPAESEPPAVLATAATSASADLTQDLRGVACPLNYVKTKMALQKLKKGQTLLALLDEQGAKNVPASAESDGHEVLFVLQNAAHWRVLIRKK
jgi:sulfite reductase (ferredoxin)